MENTSESYLATKKGTFPANVAEIIDEFKLVINRGEIDGIRKGQRMLVYQLSDQEIKDPNTGASLGYLEIVKGTGKVIHIQEKLSIIESDKNLDPRVIADMIDTEVKRLSLLSASPITASPTFTQFPELELSKKPSQLPKLFDLFKSKMLIPFENPKVGDIVKPI